MLKYFLNILFVVVLVSNSYAHKHYMSVTRGFYNAETQMMQCEMKVTAHDLEKAIRTQYAQSFNLDETSKKQLHNKLIEKYINSRIEIMVNSKYVDLEFIGFELELNDDLWIYFQFKAPEQTFEYKNVLLTELFAMQQNVTHFKTAACERSFVYTKNHSLEKFDCNE